MRTSWSSFLAAAAIVFILHLVRSGSCARSTRCCGSRSASVLAVLALFPDLLVALSDLFGIDYPPATFMLLGVSFLLVLVLHFSWELSRLEDRTARWRRSTRSSAGARCCHATALGASEAQAIARRTRDDDESVGRERTAECGPAVVRVPRRCGRRHGRRGR